jgi:enoyl-CoA hydratase/carnithine racemase
MFTGSAFTAEEARDWGMVNAVVPSEELMGEALRVAKQIANAAPISVRQMKKAVHQGLQVDLTSGLLLEVQAYERVIGSEDRQEGVLAFNEKRPPVFRGR